MAGSYGEISGAEAFSNPQTSPVYNWKQYARYFYPAANAYRRFAKGGGEQEQLYNQFKDAYLGGTDQAAANAQIYQDYAKNLFANQPNQFNNYQQVGDYLFGKFNDFRDASAAAGLKSMNSRLAALGITPGTTGYDRLLNATRITNNLAPAYAQTVNAIGRDYSGINNASMGDTLLRLGLANNDSLNQYMDRVYERPLNVADVRLGQIGSDTNAYNNLANAFKTNVAGYQTREGSDLAKFGRVFDRWASSYNSGYGGGNSAPYQAGPNQQFQPTQPYYSNNPYVNQLQDRNWMNQYNGVGANPYAGQVSPYTGGYDNYPVTDYYSAPVGDFGSGFDGSSIGGYV